MANNQDQFLTLDEVSKYLKIPKSTLYKLSQRGKIPSLKIGKQLRFRKTSLDIWVTEKEKGSSISKDETPQPQKPKHVLLIDDDELVLKTLARILKTNGYDVEPAENGEEALGKARNLNFDLVITDMRMPGMDGIETIKRIREVNRIANKPSTPEIIISAYMDTEAERQAQNLGITDYVYKPFAVNDFMDTVKRKI